MILYVPPLSKISEFLLHLGVQIIAIIRVYRVNSLPVESYRVLVMVHDSRFTIPDS
jgi:hypothetical protein